MLLIYYSPMKENRRRGIIDNRFITHSGIVKKKKGKMHVFTQQRIDNKFIIQSGIARKGIDNKSLSNEEEEGRRIGIQDTSTGTSVETFWMW